MAESQQKKLNRVRKPRVHITYDVEVGDAVVKKELPFVMGIMGDFSGNPPERNKKLGKLSERKFVNIDRDNFNDVLSKINPELHMKVENTLTGEGEISVDLDFESMSDFEPGQVVEKVPALKKLKDSRDKLRDLLTNIDKSEDLEAKFEEILQDSSKIQQLAGEAGTDDAGSDSEEG